MSSSHIIFRKRRAGEKPSVPHHLDEEQAQDLLSCINVDEQDREFFTALIVRNLISPNDLAQLLDVSIQCFEEDWKLPLKRTWRLCCGEATLPSQLTDNADVDLEDADYHREVMHGGVMPRFETEKGLSAREVAEAQNSLDGTLPDAVTVGYNRPVDVWTSIEDNTATAAANGEGEDDSELEEEDGWDEDEEETSSEDDGNSSDEDFVL